MTEADSSAFKTPMMQQYLRIKSEYPDCLLFFRMGDFYELFLDDAIEGAEILDISLTSRSKGSDGKIPMCGVPFHSVDSYLSKVVKAGRKAAICEQVSKPMPGNELVERKVIRIITPGTLIDETLIEGNKNNFLMTVFIFGSRLIFAYSDISTGEFFVFEKPKTADFLTTISNEIKRINPSEIVLNESLYHNFELLSSLNNISEANIFPFNKIDSLHDNNLHQMLLKKFNIKTLDVFGISNTDFEMIRTAAFLLSYLEFNLKGQIDHVKNIKNITEAEFMKLDADTINNLEIFESNRIGSGRSQGLSLFKIINLTKTSMGERLLRRWILFPLINKPEILKRQDAVDYFIQNKSLLREVQEKLKEISDLERIISRLGTGRANARDLLNLANSLENSLKVQETLRESKPFAFEEADSQNIKTQLSKIGEAINPNAPLTIREGSLINAGYNENLDNMKNQIKDNKEWISSLENIEKAKTRINNLKVGFNSVFGYYIEITKSNLNQVPAHYIRKQTLVNAERYITQELKEKEDIVLTAEEKINELEYELFVNLTQEVLTAANQIQKTAQNIAYIDCINSFAQKALEKNYTRPQVLENFDFCIKEGRHPVVEESLSSGEFTPNDTNLTSKEYIHLITGPNMAGKSTYIRQVALLQLMAQIGSYVPAFEAQISLSDGIYTRIGAGDALAQGLSTFMVEMVETARIINNATSKSLIILDEVGRGTSTIDGLSIAKAVVEFLHNKTKAKTLFATHFHELTSLDQKLKHLANYHIKAVEENGKIKFMHRVDRGGTDKSYGIEVARLAGIPEEIIQRAQQFLSGNSSKQLSLEI